MAPRLEISFDVQLSLRRLRRYGWKWSRDWEYALDLAVRCFFFSAGEGMVSSRGRGAVGNKAARPHVEAQGDGEEAGGCSNGLI